MKYAKIYTSAVLIVFSRKLPNVIEYIDDLSETDNEQNKRSEEKQKTQPFPCIEVGFAPVLLSYEKNGERIFPRSPPRRIESSSSSFLRSFLSHSLLPSLAHSPSLTVSLARLRLSFFLPRAPERAGKGDEGWQSTERNYWKVR